MRIVKAIAAAAFLVLASGAAANAEVYTIAINDNSQSISEVDTLGTPFTPHIGWSEGALQTWGFGTNTVAGGGWLDFFNSTFFSYPAGEQLQKEGGASGNVTFDTTAAFYTLTGFGADYALTLLPGSYSLTDGGTLTVSAVPEAATWAMLILGFLGVGFMMRGARGKRALNAA